MLGGHYCGFYYYINTEEEVVWWKGKIKKMVGGKLKSGRG